MPGVCLLGLVTPQRSHARVQRWVQGEGTRCGSPPYQPALHAAARLRHARAAGSMCCAAICPGAAAMHAGASRSEGRPAPQGGAASACAAAAQGIEQPHRRAPHA
jgi:hypothetical protein